MNTPYGTYNTYSQPFGSYYGSDYYGGSPNYYGSYNRYYKK